ncbi:MAG: cation-translocating P-type ATPase [Oscillospiraceae bacterium]|nr:cation-translocating P-type ATPase [Oscillospiraceae bacterium]
MKKTGAKEIMERFTCITDKIDEYRGLSSDQAADRLVMYGYNGNSRHLETDGDFKVFRAVFSFRFLVMVTAALVMLLAKQINQGFVMLILAFIYSGVEVFKGLKCRDGFYELKRISGVRFRVLRDGAITLLRREYIVPDDIIILQEGESVPADAHLLEARDLSADESMFTDDRTPAIKRAGADGKNEIKQTCIYKGTRILSGSAVARVTATGLDTKKCRELGEVYEKKAYVTGIEKAAGKISPVFFASSSALFIMFFMITLFTREKNTFAELALNSLLPAFSLALCLIPAECSGVVRAHYLFGAFSLLKKNCVVKDLNSIETLSAVTAVCVDKTGVITKNHTSPVDEYTTDEDTMSKISVLSCERNVQGDPSDSSSLDRAIILGAAFKGVDVKSLHENELICRYPFSEETKIGGNLWNINGSLLLCVKGSPESILTKCVLPPDNLFAIQQKQQKYSEQGHRVVAVAYARIENGIIPESIYDADYTFVGLAAFENRTRDSAPAAVRSCYKAGVKVIMTTGDSTDAALVIGKKIGLSDAKAVTGDYLRDALDNYEKPEIEGVNIFARITPDQKSHIIELLKDEGEIVAVTGIGATDVEALESANVGVALPQETSGAAKEVCGLVLADDDFNSVVDAIKETRQIHYNIKQSAGIIICTFTVMLTFALFCLFGGGSDSKTALSPILMSLPAVLILPILLLAFFGNRSDIKSFMSASGFVGRRALDKRFLIRAVTQGLCVSLVVLIFQLVFKGESPEVLRSCFLAAMTGGLIGAVCVNLSGSIPAHKLLLEKSNSALLLSGITLLLVIIITYIPGINSAFGLAGISPLRFIPSLVFGLISQAWVEIPKFSGGNYNKDGRDEI